MEMESSRRLEKASREQLAYKKPRLVEEPAERNPRYLGTAGFASSRVRAVERDGKGRNGVVAEETKDREDSGRGGTLHLQELLSQYKAALGELTFNSKPIITNLTIIAGENTSAVKGIAATICTNIIEVPGDQKLPSLYLLDSIVKNIGGDYVKYFATKLPEVFCKAYRQVDPSIYPSMQHLFKTWRGVFPPEPLRFIEKELGFPPVVNSSPVASSVVRAEPQSQRPAHSIHVNPKYLEARQRLQQAGKVKGGGSENSTSSLSDDSERPEHPSTSGASKPWPESSAKSGNRPQRALYSSETLLTKRPAPSYAEYDIGSGAAINPDLGGRRLSARVAEPDESAENPWYRGGEDTGIATDPEKGNGYDMPRLPPRGVTNVNKTSGSSRSDRLVAQANPARSTGLSHGLSRSWKNSDEEEFLWDEMNSKSSEYRLNDGPKREDWSRDETEASSAFQYQKPLPTVKSEIPNVNWGGLGTMPSRRKLAGADRRFSPEMELDDLSREPPNWKDIGNRDKESLSELFSTRQGSEDFAGRQPGHVSSDQHSLPSSRSQAPSNDIATISASMNSNQLNGQPYIVGSGASSNLPPVNKIGYRPVAGPSVPSFGSSLNGMIEHQRQQYQKPPSPSSQVHQYPNSPVSTVISQPPFEQQQLTHFRDQDHLLGPSFTVSGHHKIPPVPEQANPTQIPGNLETLSFSSQKDNTGGSLPKPLALQTLKFPHSSPTVTSHPPLPHLEPSLQQPHIQPYGQLYQQSLQPTNYGSHQSLGFSKTMNLQGQSNVDSLLATILKSGVPSSQPPGPSDMPMLNSSFTPLNALEFGRSQTQSSVIQPPLPSGPPPSVQPVSSSRMMAVSSATLLGPSLPTSVPSSVMLPRMLQPPLPPGPPPASSIMAASSQISNSPDLLANSFSSLLNSLMAQGFLKASEPTPAPVPVPGITPVGRAPTPTPTPAPIPTPTPAQAPASAPAPALAQEIRKLPQPVQRLQVQNKDGSIASISSELAPVPATTTTLTPSENEASIFKYCSFPAGHSGPSSEIENMIGIDFKPEKIRTFHQYVIDWLYGDLMHQCSICGLRLKDEENLDKHSDWHASKSHKMSGNNNSSRKWSLSLASWVKGGAPSSLGSMSAYDGDLIFPDELPDSVVPADENQWICAFCGEAFEDFYSDERDEWMFKGAAYMAVPSTDAGIVESSSEQHLIVHAYCMPNTIQMSDVS